MRVVVGRMFAIGGSPWTVAFCVVAVLAAGVFVGASPVLGHLALSSPVSRYGGGVLKVGPCGAAGAERTANVTTLAAGATLELVWDEYIDHPGHFRIAFDDDGDDDFVDPACLSGCDTRTPEIELYSNATVLLDGITDTVGGESRVTVTLPDVECDNCTLQVIQVMYDKPPYVTPGNDLYYQCADLVLRRSVMPTPTPACAVVGGGCDCVGDCNDDGIVDISELIKTVRIALEIDPVPRCLAGDLDGDGSIQVSEIVAAVRNSLMGCW